MRYPLVLLVLLACDPQGIHGPAEVIDGDSLVVDGVEIRLQGIDAPEWEQVCTNAAGEPWPCGKRVTQALAGWLAGHEVTCVPLDTDRYGRTVARCHVGGFDVAEMLVRAGGAVAYTRYSRAYVDDERLARDKLRGLWAGEFVEPETWRHR